MARFETAIPEFSTELITVPGAEALSRDGDLTHLAKPFCALTSACAGG
jgi:hypothetical protein